MCHYNFTCNNLEERSCRSDAPHMVCNFVFNSLWKESPVFCFFFNFTNFLTVKFSEDFVLSS